MKSFCAYKLDLSKTYDRLDWNYLKQMMQKAWLCSGGLDNVLCYLDEIFSKIQWSHLGYFASSCGLRQGDPLSPYLFLFVANGLSALINKGCTSRDISMLKFEID